MLAQHQESSMQHTLHTHIHTLHTHIHIHIHIRTKCYCIHQYLILTYKKNPPQIGSIDRWLFDTMFSIFVDDANQSSLEKSFNNYLIFGSLHILDI